VAGPGCSFGVVSPGALSPAAVGALLAGAFGAAPGEGFARSCHAVTGGNPFLVRELIETLRADGIGPGEAAPARPEVAPAIKEPPRSWSCLVPGSATWTGHRGGRGHTATPSPSDS